MAKPNTALARLGAAVRAARAGPELTQERLAFRAHLDRTYVGFIERGLRNPTFLTLSAIREALGITWKEFGALLDRDVPR